jgi:aminoglycoside 6'-N-acetyltransferase
MGHVFFKQLDFEDLEILCKWMNEPHVQEFYSLRSWTQEEVMQKFRPYILKEKPVLGFTASVDHDPIGYIQYYRISEYPWPDQDFKEEMILSSAGVDLFIGDPYFIRKGWGGKMMENFLSQQIWPQFENCVVDPHLQNQSAIRFFEKIGFYPHKVINSADAMGQAASYQLIQ